MATKAKTPSLPVEENTAALQAQLDAHDATMDSTSQVDQPEASEEVDSQIMALEREIYDTKLSSETPVLIPFNKLTWHDNVRTAKTLVLPAMIHSLKTRGFIPKYPIMVSKRGNEYLVLCGNRRTEALKKIQEAEPEIFKVILPDGKIPALVFEGLTEREEIILRNDHSSEEDRVGLDDEGLFNSVKQLVRVGFSSQSDIAAKLNLYIEDRQTKKQVPNRSFIQQRVNLARLPAEVQDEFVKFFRGGKDASNVRMAQTPQLFKLYNKGRRAGELDGGAEFKTYWEQCKAGKTRNSSTSSADDQKMMTRSEMENRSQTMSSRIVQQVLMLAAGYSLKGPDGELLDLTQVDAYSVQCETALADLSAISESMGKKAFKDLMTKIAKERQELAKAAMENAES